MCAFLYVNKMNPQTVLGAQGWEGSREAAPNLYHVIGVGVGWFERELGHLIALGLLDVGLAMLAATKPQARVSPVAHVAIEHTARRVSAVTL